jgi:hypothetical protein
MIKRVKEALLAEYVKATVFDADRLALVAVKAVQMLPSKMEYVGDNMASNGYAFRDCWRAAVEADLGKKLAREELR